MLNSVSHKRIIGFIVSLALFMDALDTTILNTAIPTMSNALHVHPVDLKIALISYLINLAIFIPISGWAADRYGIKHIFIAALIIFTLSSFFCGFSHNLTELVLARSLQGVGGAFMLPLGRLIILHTFPRHEVVDAMNHVIMVVSVGLMLGPLAGGLIVDHLTWPWIFWVNIPVGILAASSAHYWIKDTQKRHPRPLDTAGFILFGGGLAAFTFALSDVSESTADARSVMSIMLLSILMLLAYFLHSRKQPYPILDIKLFDLRTFQVSILGNLFSRLGFGGMPFLLPLLLQISLGYSAQLSGLLLVPVAAGILIIKYFSLPILRLFGYKRLLIINTFIVGGVLMMFQVINHGTPVYLIACLTFMFGFVISLQYSSMNSLAYADLLPEQFSSATSIVSVTQQVAQSFGVAVAAILLQWYSASSDQHFMLTPVVFHRVFFTMGVITLFSTIIFSRMSANDGYQMLTAPQEGADEQLVP